MANMIVLEIKGSDRVLDVSAIGVGAGQNEIRQQHRFIVTLFVISPSASFDWKGGRREGPGKCSVGKLLAMQPWQPEFSPQNPCEKGKQQGRCPCKTGEAETDGSTGPLASQAGLTGQFPVSERQTLSLK